MENNSNAQYVPNPNYVPPTVNFTPPPTPVKSSFLMKIVKLLVILAISIPCIFVLSLGASVAYNIATRSGKPPKASEVQLLQQETPSNIDTEQLADTANSNSELTSIKRDSQQKEFVGKVVMLELSVKNVEVEGKNQYLITGDPGIKFSFLGHSTKNLSSETVLTATSPEDKAIIESLKTGQQIKIKARIKSFSMGGVVKFDPAVLQSSIVAPSAVMVPNSPTTKILSKEEAEQASEYAKSLARDKAQEENIRMLQEKGESPNINAAKEAPARANANLAAEAQSTYGRPPVDSGARQVDVTSYVNRFDADCSSSKKRDAITLGGMNEREAATLASKTCKPARNEFTKCIAKPGTTYKACYADALISAE